MSVILEQMTSHVGIVKFTFEPTGATQLSFVHPLMAPKLSFLAIWGPFGAPIGPPDQRKGSIALPRVCPVKVRDVYCSNIT